jgi:hypothetical protein
MRGKGLVGTRVELAGDLSNEIGKYRHDRNDVRGVELTPVARTPPAHFTLSLGHAIVMEFGAVRAAKLPRIFFFGKAADKNVPRLKIFVNLAA